MQNAVDHGFPEGSGGGKVVVKLDNDDERLHVQVIDDGQGLEPGFDLDTATGLGLSIVRTLVTTELNGQISMRPATAADLAAAGLDEHAARRRPRHGRRARRAARRTVSLTRDLRACRVATYREHVASTTVMFGSGDLVADRIVRRRLLLGARASSTLVVLALVSAPSSSRACPASPCATSCGASPMARRRARAIGLESAESPREQRRRQRIDAAARMLNHVVDAASSGSA